MSPASEEILVEITGLAPGGDAVGRQRGGQDDGRVTFVPLAAPGELVRARVVRARARVAWAELSGIERPGSARVTPPCPLFGRCGGCQWQHVDEATQRRQKGGFVSRALGIEVGEARAVGPAYGYRERARLHVAPGGRAIGFLARRSHEVVDVPACLLLAPSLARALPVLRAEAAGASGGDQIPLQGGRDGEVAWLHAGRMRRLEPAPAPLEARDIEARDPGGWPDVAEPGGPSLRVPPGGFSQVGLAANRALVTAVSEALGPDPGRVLELHAGSGTFTRALVERATEVIASDADRAAVARGQLNAPRARWYLASALGDEPADTVVVDPPREGLDALSLARAAAARRRLVYVSCDPQTLARDGKALAARGWRLQSAVAFDLMPQTHHVEVVAVFVADPARGASM
jgi:23S rRNA (uracil1939-C5)-methyltransferase